MMLDAQPPIMPCSTLPYIVSVKYMWKLHYLWLLISCCCLATVVQADASNRDALLRQYDALPLSSLKMDKELRSLLDMSQQLEHKSVKNESANSESDMPMPISLDNITPPLRVLIDVRSNHSDGAHDFQTLIDLAKKRQIDVLTFTEHDRYTIRFGIDPMPHILGYSMEHPSLYDTGLDTFFTDLSQAQQNNPDIALQAGTESTAGYYWLGIPFKNLSLHNAERHFITLGVHHAAQVRGLSSYDLRHAYGNTELSLIFWFVLVFMLIFYLLRKRKRGVALLLAGSFIAFMTTWLTKPVVDPDVAFINSAHEQGLWTIWTHPGTLSGVRLGPMGVKLDTPPYNQRVFKLPTADAFAAVYGDSDHNTMAGGLWDQFMMDYMQGYLPKPIWAVAAGDYHEEGQSHEFLGNFPMDVWAKSSAQADILTALSQGRMTAWSMQKSTNIAVKALYLSYIDPQSQEEKQLLAGEEAVVPAEVTLVVALHSLTPQSTAMQIKGQWIVDGHIAADVMLSTDEHVPVFGSTLHLSKGTHVIRLQIPSQHNIRMEANPFLVRVQ